LKIMTNSRDELSWKRVLKLYPKIGEKTAADVWGRISQARDPLDSFLNFPLPPGEGGRRPGEGRGVAGSLDSLRTVLRPLATESMKHNPSESIRLVVEKGYADYARSKFPNAQARLDDLEQLSQYALRYDDVIRSPAKMSRSSARRTKSSCCHRSIRQKASNGASCS